VSPVDTEISTKSENKKKKIHLMQGNEACAEGALAAGCRFFAGYPITPSSEIGEYLALHLPRVGGNFIQMEDEISAMAAVIGASISGVKSMTATSGPGFSLKQENIGFACMTEIPCVIVNVMRGGPSTGFPTGPSQGDLMQARWGTHGDHPIIVVAPATVKEVFSETIRAFNLSETFRVPVILLMDEVLGHMREKVVFPQSSEYEVVERIKPDCAPEDYLPYANDRDVSPLVPFGEGYRYHITGLYHDESGFPTGSPEKIRAQIERLMGKIERGTEKIRRVELTGMASPKEDRGHTGEIDVLVVAFGSTARAAQHAVNQAREQTLRVGLFRPLTIWPFPAQELKALSKRVRKVIVPEMNLGQLSGEVQRWIPSEAERVNLNRVDGIPISPDEILEAILK
jgi:2-oxoglutarate ferredoxin oxidoreductase subunit alpha